MDFANPALLDALSVIPDPRKNKNILHDLKEMLVMAICAVTSGAEGFEDIEMFAKAREEWFRKFLALKNGVPSHDTFNRVFRILDREALAEFFLEWTKSVTHLMNGEVIAVDGKVLRRSLDRGVSPLYLINAWATENGVVLGQDRIEGSEIESGCRLLEKLWIKGCIVTADAASCHKDFCAAVVKQGADYVLSLKGNQERLFDAVSFFFGEVVERKTLSIPMKTYVTEEVSHGRDEKREYYMCEEIDWIDGIEEWPFLKSIGMVVSTRQSGDSFPTVEVRYYISSLAASAQNLERAVRSHWHVENKAHWSLDVTFKEDECRVRKGNAAENLAGLRRLSLNMLKRNTDKGSVRGKVKRCGWDLNFLLKVLAG